MLILVVEDDASFREVLTDMLTDGGHQVVTAPDALAAVAMLATLPSTPSLLLLDLQLPQLTGGELQAAIQRDPVFAHIPIVVVTGLDPQDARLRVPSDVPILHKPVSLDDLLATVAEVGRPVA
jgi:CheY-like chemotaxis protein